MAEILETLLLISFGISWPISIRKSWVSRTAKGKSLLFEVFLLVGYAFGIARKVVEYTQMDKSGFLFFLSFAFYIINFCAISVDVSLYFRNAKLDRERAEGES